MPQSYQRSGYLNTDFRLFHIIDKTQKSFEYHYHDFHKILIFLQGNVSYIVEGKQYALTPGDILMVQAGEIHKPIIHDTSDYERIILYVSQDFFEQYRADDCDLFRCFDRIHLQDSGLIRMTDPANVRLAGIYSELKQTVRTEGYAGELYQRVKFLEFLIVLNRLYDQQPALHAKTVTANPVVQNILKYINDHLEQEDLSVDGIAQAAYLNRSYLMHLFKAETGYTIGKYIAEKRLFQARNYIAKGLSVTDACYQSGFRNYTAFYYAYKNKYGSAPTREAKPHFPDRSSE